MNHLLLVLALVAASHAQTLQCGQTSIKPHPQVSNAILNGSPALPYSWPWMAALCKNNWFGQCEYQCAGVIIGKRWIMSNTNCMTKQGHSQDWRIRTGVYDESKGNDAAERTYKIAYLILGTVALYQTDSDIVFDSYRQPVCLPESDGSATDSGKYGRITGWGYQKKGGSVQKNLNEATIMFDDIQTCSSTYDDTGINYEGKLCAGTGTTTICNHDEGDPIVVQSSNGRWYMHGIAYEIDKDCRLPGIFNRISYNCDDIKKDTKGEVTCVERS